MNLHRASKKADWELIEPSQRSFFQKVAAYTQGFVTPANIITLLGLGIVLFGLHIILQGSYIAGLAILAFGRLLDIADGLIADLTKTKSPIGEMFDAAADKIGTILTILVLLVAEIAPWWIILVLIVPQLVTLVIVYYKTQKNIRVHPTWQGKFSMALAWMSVVSLILVKAVQGSLSLELSTYIIALASSALGLYATWQYATGRGQENN